MKSRRSITFYLLIASPAIIAIIVSIVLVIYSFVTKTNNFNITIQIISIVAGSLAGFSKIYEKISKK